MHNKSMRICKLFIWQALIWAAFVSILLAFLPFYEGKDKTFIAIAIPVVHVIAFCDRYSQALKSVLDIMYPEECEATVKINGAILNAWDWGILGNGIYGKIYCYYPETRPQRPMKERDYLFRGNIIYDVGTHGHPDFNKNSLYRITYLRFSKIITKIEDLSPNAPQYPVYVSIDEYARRAIEREERKQRKTERKNKKG